MLGRCCMKAHVLFTRKTASYCSLWLWFTDIIGTIDFVYKEISRNQSTSPEFLCVSVKQTYSTNPLFCFIPTVSGHILISLLFALLCCCSWEFALLIPTLTLVFGPCWCHLFVLRSDTCRHVGSWWRARLLCWVQPCQAAVLCCLPVASSTLLIPCPSGRSTQKDASLGELHHQKCSIIPYSLWYETRSMTLRHHGAFLWL